MRRRKPDLRGPAGEVLAGRMRPRIGPGQHYQRAVVADIKRAEALVMPIWRRALRQIAAMRGRADAEPEDDAPGSGDVDPAPILLAAVDEARALLRGEWAPRVAFGAEAEPIVSWALSGAKVAVRSVPPGAAFGQSTADRIKRIDVFANEQRASAVQSWIAENTSLVSSVPFDALDNLSRMVAKHARIGTQPETLARLIQQSFGSVSESRARLIARDQTAKLNADIQRHAMQASGSTSYIWRTAEDERVRPDHARLDRQTFRWSDPPVTDDRTGARNHPGRDFQCRCVGLPVYDDLPSEADLDAELAAMLG